MFDSFFENSDLPTLSEKQMVFVMRYVLNNFNASEAYRFAYNCENMSNESVNVEASRLLKNPKIALWIDYYKKKAKVNTEKQFLYSLNDAFKEINDLQKRCSTSPKTYNVERSCIETKCKIAGLFDSNNDKPAVVVNMGKVEYNGKNLELNVGEDANAQTA